MQHLILYMINRFVSELELFTYGFEPDLLTWRIVFQPFRNRWAEGLLRFTLDLDSYQAFIGMGKNEKIGFRRPGGTRKGYLICWDGKQQDQPLENRISCL